MLNSPKVSVIVPVFNTELYLKTCIDSLLCQTYSNIEIILVNDGSTDKSASICDDYIKKDNRIKVIHQNNQGVVLSRRNGLKNTSGLYVMFVDSDDYIGKSLIEKLIAASSSNPDIIRSGLVRISQTGEELFKFYAPSNMSCEITYDKEYFKNYILKMKMADF